MNSSGERELGILKTISYKTRNYIEVKSFFLKSDNVRSEIEFFRRARAVDAKNYFLQNPKLY
ncbi:hypothetical protein DRF69_18430 [Chryseobacterium sp. 5_R23647]|nr:hypothetical protein DRF69_18430 [Chryseobacterium sp. 5_R23647]